MMSRRQKILIANWKMHHHRKTAQEFLDQVVPSLDDFSNIDLAIAPPAPMLDFVGRHLPKKVALASQNVFYAESGAFTGEYSASQIKELGVKYCIVGHSERRNLFFETDQDVFKKIEACMRAHIIPIVCIGESAAIYEQNLTEQKIKEQLKFIVNSRKNYLEHELIIAYEPIWAIGTGKRAERHDIEKIHHLIRENIYETLGKSVANSQRIIYGGSVTTENIEEIAFLPGVDGVLVGGASLQAASFLSMVKALQDV
jgi:triosephosphate isomerase (TIM)